jgi:hypothetical protein
LRLGGVGSVFLECARQRKFTELVTDHVFCDKHGVENLAVVDVERQADEFGRDGRAPGPRLDRSLLARALGLLDFDQKMFFNIRTFFNRTSHKN